MTRTEAQSQLIQMTSQPAPADVESREKFMEWAGRFLIVSSGDEPNREGLEKTPERFAKAFHFLTSGYQSTVAEVVGEGVFETEGRGLVTVSNIEYYSLCEHHLLPFWGEVSIAYYPNEHILGLSKLARITEVFARRLQVQERMTRQIAEAIQQTISPRAVAVRASGRHLCMMMRGVEKQNSVTHTEFSLESDGLTSVESERLWKSLS